MFSGSVLMKLIQDNLKKFRNRRHQNSKHSTTLINMLILPLQKQKTGAGLKAYLFRPLLINIALETLNSYTIIKVQSTNLSNGMKNSTFVEVQLYL